MPTEAQFTAAANRCRAAADNLAVTEWDFRALEGQTGLDGLGTVKDRVERGIVASYLNAAAVRNDFESTAAVLDTRASEAAAYSSEVKAWRRRLDRWQDARALHFAALDAGEHPAPLRAAPTAPPKVPHYVDETNPGSLW